MLLFKRSYTRALIALLAAMTIVGGVSVLIALSPSPAADAASVGQLQQQISTGQGQVSNLAGQVGAASSRLAQLNASIGALESRISRVQADLDARRSELIRLRDELAAAKRRLAQLIAFENRAEHVLSQQLINSYEGDRPDIVSVVLESHGFPDLLERLQFAQRIRKQDVQIIRGVRTARRAVAAAATRLGRLEVRQQALTNAILLQRNALASDRLSLVRQQLVVARDRDAKAGKLADARGRVADLQHQLSQLQAAQAAAAARAAAASSASSAGSGSSGGAPVSPGQVSSSGFAFPLPKSAVSPPGTWTLDQGVDMAAPGDTPEYAVCSGTIVLHGIGGFGPWAPVLHCDSSIGGYDYVYYGHAGPSNQLPVGTHVSAGEAMSSIGPGIVGVSTGPHIEIGFADASGTPVGGGSASTMMSLLQGSY